MDMKTITKKVKKLNNENIIVANITQTKILYFYIEFRLIGNLYLTKKLHLGG
jgi:hypothetical protein